MEIILLSLFQQAAKITNKYVYNKWVVDKTATDLGGNLKTKNYLFH